MSIHHTTQQARVGLCVPDEQALREAPTQTQAPTRTIHGIRCELVHEVEQVPMLPGCYLWKNASDIVIYVGKAKNLRARMLQYVTLSDDRLKIPRMMLEVASFDYVVVSSEHEALVLERNLIEQYKPYYNVDFKDDKSYPYIALTKNSLFPAIKYTREHHKRGTKYFGPYTDVYAARETIEILRKAVPLCSASCTEWKRLERYFKKHADEKELAPFSLAQHGKACFDYHMQKAPGACIGRISVDEYHQNVALIEDFLSGKRKHILDVLQEHMRAAAQDLEFEKAGRIKHRLQVLQALNDKQKVVFSSRLSMDCIGFYREETISAACVFIVREGRVIRTNEFILNKGLDVSKNELQESFIKRYYHQTADIPAEINLDEMVFDVDALSNWLSEKRGSNVTFRVPQRGEKRDLLAMVIQNASCALKRYSVRTGYSEDRTNLALTQLESALALDRAPLRIECFDISTLHGYFTVASMIVFTNGRADKSQYRRFIIKTPLDEANDFVSMQEVLSRRYSKKTMSNKRFGKKPDLLVLDGGKPQLSAALSQLRALDLDIPVCGLAKSDEEVFVPWDTTPIVLPSGSASLYLIKQVRDESHRFAITFHRELRDKAMTKSILDSIEGVGPKRKHALLTHFGSMKRLRAASVRDIAQVSGISAQVAQNVWEVLQTWH